MTDSDPIDSSRPLTVAVLCGGRSTERDVSLDSGRCIANGLEQCAPGRVARVALVEWRADGEFELDGERLDAGAALARLATFDACVLALHGGAGEDGTIQGWFELGGVSYTGSGVAASAFAMDKHVTRLVGRSLGLAVAPGVACGRGDDLDEALEPLRQLRAAAYFVKDRRGGSSIGTTRVESAGALVAAARAALETVEQLVVEVGVVGTEVSCAVFDGTGRAEAWPVIEVVPTGGLFFDFQQKYDAQGASEFCPPRTVGEGAQRIVQDQAVRLFRALGCRGVARVDFVLPASDENAPVLLELNTLPGMTPRSLVPLAAAQVGLDYPALCLALARAAAHRPS
ncbi:D-alanine--D-alanine ligase Ddl [Planctomycetes bacterium Pla163]|uniref:D-alanine--D-alanine ligase n=1 Tax=Rohdeia mirabilis TaxID=2528008 RepID=A0A518D0K6_9BACT|nr:D-alanine--D-alanine ligase Ddl [Planctomycetes bacterium Pla163]